MNTQPPLDSRIGSYRPYYVGEISLDGQRHFSPDSIRDFSPSIPMQIPINRLTNTLTGQISVTETAVQTLPADRNFLDGAMQGVKDTGSDLLAAGKLAWQLSTSSQEREQFASAIGKVAESLQDPTRREQTLKLIGSELGKGLVDAFQHFSEDPDYYSGYLAGNIAAGGAFGKLAKVAATTAKLDEVAAKVWGTAQRLEIKAGGLGSNGANIKLILRPFLNKTGMFYPNIPDARTNSPIPFPTGDIQKTPKSERVSWGGLERSEFIKEWHDRGYEVPRGGWTEYDIHHILPREFGGTNEFWNLVPVQRATHQQELNKFWRDM